MILIPLLLLALWVWAIVDVIMADEYRLGERWVWLVVVLLGFVIGAVIYFVLGRSYPEHSSHPSRLPRSAPPRPSRRPPRGPDDDPDFLSSL